MFKIVTFIIIVFLILLCIYLITTMFKPSKEEVKIKHYSAKNECEILINTLKIKLKEAHEDAIAGKADAISKMTQYELELKQNYLHY